MNILITNDDGIDARGIRALAEEICKNHETLIVAPREQQSATSHSISINKPIKIKEEKLEGLICSAYSVLGTPADCTQAGISLLGKDIDLVISGINRGLNAGTDVLYSGTVSAAIEGAIYNVPSIAVSMEVDWEKDDEDYSKAVKWTSKILKMVEKEYLRGDVVLNINIPNIKDEDIKGIKVCRIGKSTYNAKYTLIEDSEDKIYKKNGTRNEIQEKDSDLYFLSHGYVTVTPLHFDFTNFEILEGVRDIIE
ncbi:5'/3'-nucleotidase SurE [Haloimpatiens lingqiaonensis]|uniref:5'/3'-nucleotidase SurE n=1 Tax=Haloimpatiens lingqiaonensis TaxID=1380675 RepID=UPI0010FEDBC7|nr:5'/3'-nucleotidase SurE [Haloimpatiens lingqiaonensis]